MISHSKKKRHRNLLIFLSFICIYKKITYIQFLNKTYFFEGEFESLQIFFFKTNFEFLDIQYLNKINK